MRTLVISTILAAAVPAAAQDACFSRDPESRFVRDVRPILDSYCVACHQDRSPAAGVSLQAGPWERALPNMTSRQSGGRLIVPGDPAASYLFRKIENAQKEAGGGGARMPLAGEMSDENIAKIRDWIVSCSTAE